MKLIYVSGPYTARNGRQLKENVADANRCAERLYERGWAVITPHKNNYKLELHTGNAATFLMADFEMINRCDAIFMMNRWEESPGAKAEYWFAYAIGMDIYMEEEGYPCIEVIGVPVLVRPSPTKHDSSPSQ